MNSEITVRHCRGLKEMDACVELERRVWGEKDLEIVPNTVFIVAARIGGQMLGAFHGEKMIGFTFAMPGVRDAKPFLHSHMTAVLEEYRDRGVGRRLKLFQREDALARGIGVVEWTFDPLATRNAHFNLDRLGAIVRHSVRNAYGITSSPVHRGLPTDRLTAEWHLDSPRVREALEGRAPALQGEAAEIVIPENVEDRKAVSIADVARIQERVMSGFEDWFARGYTAIATERSRQGFKYILDSKFRGEVSAPLQKRKG